MPARPHLRSYARDFDRYGCLPLTCVEGVHLIVPELGRPDHYWALTHSDRCLWHERYEEDGEGEEAEFNKLNPLPYPLPVANPSAVANASSSSSEDDDSEDEDEASIETNEESDDEDEAAQAAHAALEARVREDLHLFLDA